MMLSRIKQRLVEFAEKRLSGHLTLGPVTLYGANAMDWAVNLRLPALGVTLCAKPPTKRRGWYVYASPNATPWAAVIGCGPGLGRENGERVAQRLNVIAESPHPSDEAAHIWALWGMRPQDSGTEPGEGGGTGEPFVLGNAKGFMGGLGPGTRLAPDDSAAVANPTRVRTRHFTLGDFDA